MSLPGDAAHQALAQSNAERSMVAVLKQLVQLENRCASLQGDSDDRATLMRALRLDPQTDTVVEAVSIIEALVAFYDDHTG